LFKETKIEVGVTCGRVKCSEVMFHAKPPASPVKGQRGGRGGIIYCHDNFNVK
jgi:hypothetical protein